MSAGNNDDPQAQKYRQLFVGGLNQETTEETIKQHFEQWGEIVDCVLMRHAETNQSRCFGFITYKTAESLDDAQNNRPHKIGYREVDTKRVTPRGQSKGSRLSVKQMFVGGLKDDITEDEILEVFGRFGKIEKLELIKDRNTGKPKGFCFITFDDYDSVDKCVLMQRISVGGKSVEMKKAVPKDPNYGMRGGFRGGMRGRGGFGGGFRGFMRGRAGFAGGSNNGYGHGNYDYAGNKGGSGQENYGYAGSSGYGQENYSYAGNMSGHERHGNWNQGDSNSGNYGWNGNGFYYDYNKFGTGYGSGYGGGPIPTTGHSLRRADPY